MIILQVCAYTATYGGNFIASLLSLDEELRKKDIETRYLFPESVRNTEWCLQIQKKAIVYFAGMNRFSIKTYQQVRNAMKHAHIIHSHFELYDCIVALARKKNQRLFWHLHDSFDDEIDLPHRIINKLQYKYLSKKVTLISPSRHYANRVAELGFDNSRIRELANCINVRRLKYDGSVLPKYDFLIFGGFYQVKGLDILLNACRILRSRYSGWTVGVVGYDSTWDWVDKNYADLESFIQKLPPSKDISKYYNESSVFLSASRRECFSYALLEALYMGKPAIVSEIPGNKWATKYETVLTFASENEEELAQCMERYLNKRHWFSEGAKVKVSEEVEKMYGITRWVEEMERIYLES